MKKLSNINMTSDLDSKPTSQAILKICGFGFVPNMLFTKYVIHHAFGIDMEFKKLSIYFNIVSKEINK